MAIFAFTELQTSLRSSRIQLDVMTNSQSERCTKVTEWPRGISGYRIEFLQYIYQSIILHFQGSCLLTPLSDSEGSNMSLTDQTNSPIQVEGLQFRNMNWPISDTNEYIGLCSMSSLDHVL